MRASLLLKRRCRSLRTQSLECRLAMAAGPLVVTEVMYNPAAPTAAEQAAGYVESDFEFIELQNVGDQSLALGGYALSKGATFAFDPIYLGAREHVVLVNNLAAFALRQGAGINVAGEYTGNLGNSGDELILKNPDGQTTLSFKFSDTWYASTDGGGRSLTIINPQAPANTWGQAASWHASDAAGGSPGRIDGPVDASAPSIPQSLSATLVNPTRVDLSWQASADAQSGVRSYHIYRNGLLVGTSITPAYSDTSALPNSSYSYQVSAANPYNAESPLSSAASVVIAPIGTDPTFGAGQILGVMTGTGAAESSGIAASRRNPGVLYVNNDGPSTGLYVINTEASFLGRLNLSGVSSVDWEDIAMGPGPQAGTSYIYVGDIGDNNSIRPSINIYRLPEPAFDAHGGDQTTTLAAGQFTAITLQYPDGAYDSETLLVDPQSGDLFCITKNLLLNRIYRAAAADLATGGPIVLTYVGDLDFPVPSAGEISPNGGEILIRNEDLAHLYTRLPGQSVADALSTAPRVVPVIGRPTEPNGEAIAFEPSGDGYYTISEGISPPLFYFHRTSVTPPPLANSTVVNRQVFYNNSAFDGNDVAADARDDLAIAIDKQALLAGGTATLANYTSYSRGLNGIAIDIQSLPVGASLSAADFSFSVGNDNLPSAWPAAPAPSQILIRRGAGLGGADRVELVWADRAIARQWLQVTVLANSATGLNVPDTFYFGNAIGETGNAPGNAAVNAADELAARANASGVTQLVAIDNAFDFDRDRRINATDQILARTNSTTLASALNLIAIPIGLTSRGAELIAVEQLGLASQSADVALHNGFSSRDNLATKAASPIQVQGAIGQTAGKMRSGVAELPSRRDSASVATHFADLRLSIISSSSAKPLGELEMDDKLYELIASERANWHG